MVRGRGFEPLNPYGTRSPNIPLMFLSFAYTRLIVSRAFDLASPFQVGLEVWQWEAKRLLTADPRSSQRLTPQANATRKAVT